MKWGKERSGEARDFSSLGFCFSFPKPEDGAVVNLFDGLDFSPILPIPPKNRQGP